MRHCTIAGPIEDSRGGPDEKVHRSGQVKCMSRWKSYVVALTLAIVSVAFAIFLLTGYTALYWAWVRGNLQAALSYVGWARNFGMLAMAGAAAALAILFSSKAFPITAKVRLALSFLATLTIGFFSEFRNEGKFHLRTSVHFFGPGTWIHDELNRALYPLGDFLYRIEYSHWNDFLMGPAIVSVLFSIVFVKIFSAFRNQGPISLGVSASDESTDLDHALRFTRTLMNVGLFWFFIQAWAEKAGYLSNPHSKDEIDLPFEFAGTMLGFWMARVLTKPLDQRSEKFRSTFFIDFLSSGVIGLLYTLIVGPLTEAIAGTVAHALHRVVPASLEIHEYTPFQQHMRPLELLLLAGAMSWGLNWSSKREDLTRLGGTHEEQPGKSKWELQITLLKVLGVTTAYLLSLEATLSILEPQGLGWTLATAVAGIAAATASLVVIQRATRQGFMTVLGRNRGSES